MLELAELVISLTNSKSKIVLQDLPSDDPKQRKPNIDLATKHLNWQPKIHLEEGLQETINYFRKVLLK